MQYIIVKNFDCMQIGDYYACTEYERKHKFYRDRPHAESAAKRSTDFRQGIQPGQSLLPEAHGSRHCTCRLSYQKVIRYVSGGSWIVAPLFDILWVIYQKGERTCRKSR